MSLLSIANGMVGAKPVIPVIPVEAVEVIPAALVPGVPKAVIERAAHGVFGAPMAKGDVERRIECLDAPLGEDGHWLCLSLPCGDRLAGLPKVVGITPVGKKVVTPVTVDFEALLEAMVEAAKGEGGPHDMIKICEISGIPMWAMAFLFARFPLLSVAWEELVASTLPDVVATAIRAARGVGTVKLKRTLKKKEARRSADGTVQMQVTGESEEELEKGLPPDPTLAKFLLEKHPDMKGKFKEGEGGPKQVTVIQVHPGFMGVG